MQIIKAEGGMVIAQNCSRSQDFSIPETAIGTGDVDFILPLDKTAAKLIEPIGHGDVMESNGKTRLRMAMEAVGISIG